MLGLRTLYCNTQLGYHTKDGYQEQARRRYICRERIVGCNLHTSACSVLRVCCSLQVHCFLTLTGLTRLYFQLWQTTNNNQKLDHRTHLSNILIEKSKKVFHLEEVDRFCTIPLTSQHCNLDTNSKNRSLLLATLELTK